MNAKYKVAKKKLQDFVFAFSFFLSCAIISSDLGITKIDAGWVKYLTPTVWGLLFAFIIWPGNEERAKLKELKKAEGKFND
jgi:hypothetical protein